MPLENYIWYEKHRPHTLEEMVLTPDHRKVFSQYIAQKNIPHLLLHGPPGSGKTTLAFILLGQIPCHKLVLNASSRDRGVDTVKGVIHDFAASKPMKGLSKIVLLDESDFLTREAQSALRNTMENFSSSCKFILTANYVDKINEAIFSRCTAYEFNSYPKRRVLEKLTQIIEQEGVSANPDDLRKLVERFYPDMRTIINSLQSASVGGTFNPREVAALKLDPEELCGLILDGKLKSLRKLWLGLTDFTWVYKTLFNNFVYKLTEDKRAIVAIIIAEHMYKDALVIDHEINMTSCCLTIMLELGVKEDFNG